MSSQKERSCSLTPSLAWSCLAVGIQQLKDAQGRVIEGAGGHTFLVVLPELIADACEVQASTGAKAQCVGV